MYNCTKCSCTLVKGKLGRNFQYYCPNCDGKYLSFSTLRGLGYTGIIKSIWPNLVKSVKSEFSCPFCHKKQTNILYNSRQGSYSLEVCKHCQFIWFDISELNKLEKDLPLTKDPYAMQDKQLIKKLQFEEINKSPDRQVDNTDFLIAILGLPVEYNKTRIKFTPQITYVLSGIIFSVFLINFFTDGLLNSRLSFTPNAPFKFFGITLLTSFFLHANFWHLSGNLYFLYIFGDNVEDKISRFSYILLILCGHMVGILLHSIFEKDGEIPILGASAGISAILAFYVYLFPDVNIGILYLYEYIRINCGFLFIIWICNQLIFALYQIDGLSSVSGFAHLGGAATGYIFAKTYFKPSKNSG